MNGQATVSFKQRMRSGIPQIGIRSQFCSPIVVEALGFSGFDYVYIDMEHSPNDLRSVLAQCHAVAGTPAVPVVRLPSNDLVLIQQLLDAGIENLVVPMVDDAEQGRRAASATMYAPRGIRSAARAHRGNRYGNLKEYEQTVDDRICLIVQIESRTGVENVAEIAAVDGIDGLLFGPADLAADLGHFGETEHPDVTAAIERGLAGILGAGKFAGMSTGDASLAPGWLSKGCRFISVAGDIPLLIGGARRALALAMGEGQP